MIDFNTIVDAWNAQADEDNQWDALGVDEKVEFAAEYSAAQMQERCAKAVEALRVSGGTEWSEDHAIALRVLNDAATAIRALLPKETRQ